MSSLSSEIFSKNDWPNSVGVKLNQAVADLFCQTKNKIMSDLTNKSKSFLMLDLIIPQTKRKLLIAVLQEFEVLLLDIVELGLTNKDISILNLKILYDLIRRSDHRFIYEVLQIDYPYCHFSINTKNLYVKSVLKDNKVILENLIIYLLFGTSKVWIVNDNKPILKISCQSVESLLHNLIIVISDLVIYLVSNANFVYKMQLLNSTQATSYFSIRSIEELHNNINYQNFKYFYIDQPKAIYNNRYQISIFSPYGILSKTISVNRIRELNYLSYTQLLIPLILEIQDFLIPKFKYIVFIIGRLIIYIGFGVISNIIYFFFHTIAKSVVILAENS